MAEVRMPKMGDGMEEGTVLRWLKKEGERVEANESIAEIETDKANVQMPAEDAGVLTKIIVGEGQTVPVGAVIGYIGDAAGGAGGSGEQARAGNGAQPAVEPPTSVPSRDPAATGEAGSKLEAAGQPAPGMDRNIEEAPDAHGPDSERVAASPLARRMAREMGIDLARVRGTGPNGRIVQRDIQAFAESGRSAQAPPAMPAARASNVSQTSEPAAKPLAAPAAPSVSGQDVDVSRMRKAIARRTVQSKQTIPHFYLVVPVEMDAALTLLGQLNAGAAPEAKVTVNDLIVKACAVTLAKFPDVNVSWTPEDRVRRYEQINIGVAVGTDEGLTIPVVADCGSKTLRQISAEAKALINKARGNTLAPAEMSGSTFSVSNLGMFGIEEFLAIINPPDSCMLAVGMAQKEVVVAEDGTFVAKTRMRVTLSCDHRTVDGVLGARFLQELKRALESPHGLLS